MEHIGPLARSQDGSGECKQYERGTDVSFFFPPGHNYPGLLAWRGNLPPTKTSRCTHNVIFNIRSRSFLPLLLDTIPEQQTTSPRM